MANANHGKAGQTEDENMLPFAVGVDPPSQLVRRRDGIVHWRSGYSALWRLQVLTLLDCTFEVRGVGSGTPRRIDSWNP